MSGPVHKPWYMNSRERLAFADALAAAGIGGPARTDAAIAALAPVQSVATRTGAVVLAKADVGLSAVDNTADANKPISTAQAAANATFQPQASAVPNNNAVITPIFTVTPPTGAPFQFSEWSSGPQTDATYDHWFGFGFNAEVHKSAASGVANIGAWYMGFEDGWYDATVPGNCPEWYIAYFSPDHVSVPLFRPFYTRVVQGVGAAHHATTYLDIGSDLLGAFVVSANGFTPLFTVGGNGVATLSPATGNAQIIIDGTIPSLIFKKAHAQSFSFSGNSATQLALYDNAGGVHVAFNKAFSTEFFTAVKINGTVGFNGTAPIAKRATTPDATDLASAITLVNALKADLIAYGLKS